jgi:hypothetical protein
VRLWESSWAEFVPFLEYDVEIRRVSAGAHRLLATSAVFIYQRDRYRVGSGNVRVLEVVRLVYVLAITLPLEARQERAALYTVLTASGKRPPQRPQT